MLMTPPAKDPPLFKPTRAKTIETPYKKADMMARIGDKLICLSAKRDKKSHDCFSFHEPL
jgi:hypothetical protein